MDWNYDVKNFIYVFTNYVFQRPEVTNVADIIKIATMLKKKLLDNQ